jgi:LmbE family N-acetylglucosaminyl deacetylase
MASRKILIICAHPDDETFGMGATIAFHKKQGDCINLVVAATGQFGRKEDEKSIKIRENQCREACNILGISKVNFLRHPDQKLDSLPISELSSQLSSFVSSFQPDLVYTHFWNDANKDHRLVHEASFIATRPLPKTKKFSLLCFEIPSSTELNFQQSSFQPNVFVEISDFLEKKIEACKCYKNEIKLYPHPRSIKSFKTRSAFWGSVIAEKNAEVFVKVREIINS